MVCDNLGRCWWVADIDLPSQHGWTTWVPAWIEALATLAAFLAAGYAAIYVVRTYGIERQREERIEADRQEEREERRRAQAALVSAWFGTAMREEKWTAYGAEALHMGATGTHNVERPAVFVRNASELPIFLVFATLIEGLDNEVHNQRIDVVPPTESPEPTFIENDQFPHWETPLRVRLNFTDSAGQRWMRGANGELQAITRAYKTQSTFWDLAAPDPGDNQSPAPADEGEGDG